MKYTFRVITVIKTDLKSSYIFNDYEEVVKFLLHCWKEINILPKDIDLEVCIDDMFLSYVDGAELILFGAVRTKELRSKK